MGERKVLNKYFPPDFDPSKLPKGKRPDHNSMKVRMMLPMSVRCNTCGNFMYKGTKFNCKKQVSSFKWPSIIAEIQARGKLYPLLIKQILCVLYLSPYAGDSLFAAKIDS